jgi:hypothetical protein
MSDLLALILMAAAALFAGARRRPANAWDTSGGHRTGRTEQQR